jgi:hypothetical protein
VIDKNISVPARLITEVEATSAWSTAMAAIAPLLQDAHAGNRSGVLEAARIMLQAVARGGEAPDEARVQAFRIGAHMAAAELDWRKREVGALEEAFNLTRPPRRANPLDWKVFVFVTWHKYGRKVVIPDVFDLAAQKFRITAKAASDAYYRKKNGFNMPRSLRGKRIARRK